MGMSSGVSIVKIWGENLYLYKGIAKYETATFSCSKDVFFLFPVGP